MLYKREIAAKVLKVNRNQTCQILILEDQPKSIKYPKKLIDNVSIKQDITLLERFGIS